MKTPAKKPKRIRRFLISSFGVLVVAYLLYHTVEGDRGWFAMLRLKREIVVAEDVLDRLQAQRFELEHRTQLLKDNSMDPDLLDEKSRELLNYSRPDEIVILMPEKKEKRE